MKQSVRAKRVFRLFLAGPLVASAVLVGALTTAQPAHAFTPAVNQQSRKTPDLLSGVFGLLGGILGSTFAVVETVLPVTEPIVKPLRSFVDGPPTPPAVPQPSNSPAPAPNAPAKPRADRVAVTNDKPTQKPTKDVPAKDEAEEPVNFTKTFGSTIGWISEQPSVLLIGSAIFAGIALLVALGMKLTERRRRRTYQ